MLPPLDLLQTGLTGSPNISSLYMCVECVENLQMLNENYYLCSFWKIRIVLSYATASFLFCPGEGADNESAAIPTDPSLVSHQHKIRSKEQPQCFSTTHQHPRAPVTII